MNRDQLGEAIDWLSHAPDAPAAANVLRQYPGLLTPQVDEQLTQVIRALYEQKVPEHVNLFTAVRGVLRRCQTNSHLAALANQPDWPLAAYSPLAHLESLTDDDDLDEQIKWSRLALLDLDARTEPEIFGMAQFRLGYCLAQKLHSGNTTALKPAVEHLAAAVHSLAPLKDEMSVALNGRAHLNLAKLHLTQPASRRGQTIELALDCARQAHDLLGDASPDSINVHMTLGKTYLERIQGERLQNIEQSIHHYEQALELSRRPETTLRPYEIEHNLAVVHRLRLKGRKVDHYEMALAYAEQALTQVNQADLPEDWAKTTAEKAVILAHRQRGNRADNLEEAIQLTKQVLTYYKEETHPYQWSLIRLRLGNLYCDRLKGRQAANYRQAVKEFERVKRTTNPATHPFGWAEAVNNLGTAQAGLSQTAHDSYYRQAMESYRQALAVYGVDKQPERARRTAVNQAQLAFRFRQWTQAYQAFRTALDAGELLYLASGTQAGRQAELAENAGLSAKAAYCLLQHNPPQPDAAFRQLEQSKTRLLVEALALRDVDLAGLPDSSARSITDLRQQIHELEAEMHLPPHSPSRRDDIELGSQLVQKRRDLRDLITQIRQTQPDFLADRSANIDFADLIPVNGAVVAPLTTAQGSVVFVIPHGVNQVTMDHVAALPAQNSAALSQLLSDWIAAYLKWRSVPGKWKTAVTDFTQQLWPILLQPIAEKLTDFACTKAIVIPQGGLQLLPLHAAWHFHEGKRHYFSDHFEVSYAPSLSVLKMAQGQVNGRAGKQALIAGVDEYKSLPNLHNAVYEAERIAETFNSVFLCNQEASRQAIVENAGNKNYLHLACHGSFNWENALESALYLANDEPLTLNDVMTDLDLNALRLVTLSACETGITELSQLPDEFIGLPAGFMQAGAPGIVSSLWPVDDNSTAILMERFYAFILEDQMPPATALKSAQERLRRFDPIYEDPFYWAAFAFYGA
ncbi:MAG: CHAT domain-containing protein [Ardenticatenaceae bacterium]|nr:CHAT domain-containing protein [Ardenticatenaceae bacterium]